MENLVTIYHGSRDIIRGGINFESTRIPRNVRA